MHFFCIFLDMLTTFSSMSLYLCSRIQNNAATMSDYRSIPSTHRRCPSRNYSARGIYLITLCTEHRRALLGSLCGDTAAQALILPSRLGQEVLRCWRDIPAHHRERAAQKSLRLGVECRRDIQLIACQLMPDHFHGIIFVKDDMDISLGQVICGFMTGCTQAYHKMIEAAYTLPTKQEKAAVNVSVYMPTIHPTPALPPLWEKGYHDRPLWGNGQLQHMIDYVHDNPRRLWLRKHSAQLFRLHRGVRIGAQVFMAKGEMALLQRPMHVVHVRRRFSDAERRAYMNGCIIAARQGKVLVGAFISEHEQQVRAVALAEGYPVIQLTTDVLTECYKPSGTLFDACSNGQLLLLSQQEGESGYSRRITRAECNTLNTLAEELAGG